MMSCTRITPLFLLSLVLLGCDETFSPKTEFREQYVVQCFVQVDHLQASTPVTVVLAKTYDVEGFDPSRNTDDPSIAGAEVVLEAGEKLYHLAGSQRASRDTSRYTTRQWIYSSTITTPRPDGLVKLTAKLPNGKTLIGQSTIPQARNITSSYEFAAGLTGRPTLEPGKPNWTLSWENYNDPEVHLFVPRLTIAYTKLVGNDEVAGTVSVPSKYVASSRGFVPVYPSMTTDKSCSFDFPALDSAMAQISGGDPNKAMYGTHMAFLDLLEYDTPLTKYFSSINGSLDQYSIRTDESVYSNISGGIGIVGSYVVYRMYFFFDERYVARFGYRYR